MSKKKLESLEYYMENGAIDVDDLLLYVAREEMRMHNGVRARIYAIPGSILTPGIGQTALGVHVCRIAQRYLRVNGVEISNSDCMRLMFVSCLTQVTMLLSNPTVFYEEYGAYVKANKEPEEDPENKEEES